MQCRHLILACGAAVALSTTFASAQVDTGRDDERTDNRAVASSTESILKELEGSWTVTVKVDSRFWHKEVGGAPGYESPDRDANDRTENNDQDRDDNDSSPTRDSRSPAARPGSESEPAGTKTLEGRAQTRLIFDDNILQEVVVLPGTSGPTDARSPERVESNDGLQMMSFLSFDEASRKYSIVIMNDKSGKMHFDTGTYDAAARRIVFNGYGAPADVTPSPLDRTRDPSGAGRDDRTQPGQNRDNPSSPPNQPDRDLDSWTSSPGYANVRVVLEITGPDEHRVTMYKSSPVADRPTTTTSTPGTPGTTTRPGQPGSDPQTRTPDTEPLGGSVIYQATYKRSASTEVSGS
jgi:hypothetical protein